MMIGETRRDPGLWQQTFALLWKNLLLKWRRKWHTVLEWLQHLAFVLLLLIISAIMGERRMMELMPVMELGRLDEFNLTRLVVGFSLESAAASKVMEKVNQSSIAPGVTIEGFPNEMEMLSSVSQKEMVVLTFENEFKYHLRSQGYHLPKANDYIVAREFCYHEEYCDPILYWRRGILTLQANIDAAIIELATNHSVRTSMISTEVLKMQSASVTDKPLIFIVFYILTMCMCYTSLMYLLTLYIAKERKEQREILRMMGLRDLAFWLSWGLLYTFYVLVISSLMTLITTSFVFVESSFGTILLLFFLYGISMISFTFMLCALLRKPRLIAITGFFLTLFLSLLSALPLVKIVPLSLDVFLRILAPFSFAIGITETIHMENDIQGVFFSDITGDSSHLLTSYISLVLDSILYLLLTLYCDKVLADKHGLKQEPLFFLRSSYWSRRNQAPTPQEPAGTAGADVGDYVERVPSELQGREAIRVKNVKKIYSGKDKKTEALRDLDLDVYEGQITALLGHSGAGKTTLLNILSGMSTTTSGSAAIYNHRLENIHHLEEIQRRIGFCPQFDVKFDQLTVRENLKLFCWIKGISAGDVESEMLKVLTNLDMKEIQNVEANKLSGGQKRKLTLAIALLGDPEVLLLDEPTAGLDPFSRHRVWAILKERKSDRVTLFSTQFMDEADILADRKAVLSNGRLKCVGSSLFLKRKWGIGYHLRMQVSPSCNPDAITSIIQEHVSSAKLSTRNVEDLTFTLPFDKMDSFPDLFSHLDQRVGQDIMSYGVSITTLDDVFLKLEGEAEIEKGDYEVFGSSNQNEDEDRDLSCEVEDSVLLMSDSGSATLHGLALWRQQVLATARIRFLKLKHDMKSLRSILIVLVLYIIPLIIASILVNALPTIHNWKLTPDLYFRGPGHRAHKYYTSLLLHNNTGRKLTPDLYFRGSGHRAHKYYTSLLLHNNTGRKLTPDLYFRGPGHRAHKYYTSLLLHNNTGVAIQDLVSNIKAQDISVEIVNGPYDAATTGYSGAIEVSLQDKNYIFKVVGNPRAHNGLPVLLNILSNSFLKGFRSTEKIEIWTEQLETETHFLVHYTLFAVGMLLMFLASGLTPHIAMGSVNDYQIKARSQLRISGLFPSAYWCGQALVDIALHWLLLFMMIAILFAFNNQIIFMFWGAVLLILEILLYGAAVVLYVYLIAFIFRKGKVHPDRWAFLFIIFGIAFNPFYFVFVEGLLSIYIVYLLLVPTSNLGSLLSHLSLSMLMSEGAEVALFLYLVIPLAHIFIFWGVLWFLEWRFGSRCLKTDPIFKFTERKHQVKKNPEELGDADDEVLAERERVKNLSNATNVEETPAVIVDGLCREFKEKTGSFSCRKRVKKAATRDVSFCVKKGEVLGLLGPNGAGKTTTLLMLVGDLKPTAGEVVLSSGADSTDFIGYCPQFSPLWPTLTVQEHLEIYAAVKGMKKDDAQTAIKRVSEALELKPHLNKPTKKLSAGVSRKVCFAISMLGNPTIALLDEPSTGLDPRGQQRLWRAIRAAFQNKERGAILTTHYMEEAEAVCDRVAIMVSGKLRCIGSIQQLKSKFGKGYLLEIKVKDSQRVEEIHQEISRIFPQAERQDRFSSLLVYKIPMEKVQSLSQAFSQLEEAKRVHDIEEYSFSQSTLEQVFLELAKEQEKDDYDQEAMFKWRPLKTESV
ncbi:ABC-type organic anion transporter ABCA8-like isoform X1 [Engystomops pustulosus]|uniref:ABC-type organic anion transporter ABCA8-like isoform X1 n=1 Tax=Engystomops pustulosus TaxID=76066 RepID=UPI003AFAD9FE